MGMTQDPKMEVLSVPSKAICCGDIPRSQAKKIGLIYIYGTSIKKKAPEMAIDSLLGVGRDKKPCIRQLNCLGRIGLASHATSNPKRTQGTLRAHEIKLLACFSYN